MSETPRTGRSAKLVAAAVVAGLMGSGAMVWQASSAAFTANTHNDGNTWSSGKVVLTDNDANAALFTAVDLVPFSTDDNCIEVTYSGDVESIVKIYAENPTGNLGQYLDFDIELGDAGVECADPYDANDYTLAFGDVGTTVAGTDMLSTFYGANTNYSNGIAGWTPDGVADETRAYRFSWTLGDNNAAQDKEAEVDLVWEAQNTPH